MKPSPEPIHEVRENAAHVKVVERIATEQA